MKSDKIFLRIKNGKTVFLTYQFPNDKEIYEIYLSYKNNAFFLHFYRFIGNDVTDESNYIDEEQHEYKSYQDLINKLETKFPNIKIEMQS